MLRSVLHDCLFLNWALPVEQLAPPPSPLRYQPHLFEGRSHTFASLLLCHRDAPLPGLPPVGYPELHLRFTVLDGDGLPSLLCRRVLLPLWVLPGKLLTGAPAVSGARLSFPRPSRKVDSDQWTWRIDHGGRVEIEARLNSPRVGEGPSVGSWEQTVRYFQDRPRVYVEEGGGLRRLAGIPPMATVWPMVTELTGVDVIARWLLAGENGHRPSLPALHSSWLCPDVPLAYSPRPVPLLRLTGPIPQPAVGRIATGGWAAL